MNRLHLILTIIVSLTILLLCSCSKQMGKSLTVEELRAVPQVVEIEGRNYHVEAFIWRDLMPRVYDPNADPPVAPLGMMAHINIIADGEDPLPEGLDADRLWLIRGEDVWETEFSREERPSKPVNVLNKIARRGPSWQLGSAVHVVVRLKDNHQHNYYLQLPDQVVKATH